MSYNFPASIERDIEQFAQTEDISLEEAALRLVTTGIRESKRTAQVTPLADEEFFELGKRFPALNAFADVTEEQWDRIDENIRRMKQAELSTRA